MLTSLIASIAFAIGLTAPHAHSTAPALFGHAHVTAFAGTGGGPPVHP